MSIKIYVAAHKKDDRLLLLKDNPIYIPIHCGKAIYKGEINNNDTYLPQLGDDTGDNISHKNLNYCELTALYWIWKNDNSGPDDIVGLNHYRRYFREPGPIEGPQILLGPETIEKQLLELDFITSGSNTDPCPLRDENDSSVYDSYIKVHHKVDMDNTLEGIKLLFPDLYDTIYRELTESGAMCPCNLFITRKKYLDDYCSFLFPVFEYAESKVDLTSQEYNGYQGRFLGFLAERLMRAWLVSRGYLGRCGNSIDWDLYVKTQLERSNL